MLNQNQTALGIPPDSISSQSALEPREKVGTGFSQKAMPQQGVLEHRAIQANRPML
jgi:hypothetical protein